MNETSKRNVIMRRGILAILLFLILPGVSPVATAGTMDSLEGTWSAPSLSKHDIPIVFAILPGGEATEQIGDYHGAGTWKQEDKGILILWASDWVGLLRPATDGTTYELLTWKKGSRTAGPPDDSQPAKRISTH